MARYVYDIAASATIADVASEAEQARPGVLPGELAGVFARGVVRPFARDQKGDVATASGAALVRANVAQVLGTRCDSPSGAQGELPFNTSFGSLLYMMRHVRNSDAFAPMVQHYVVDALARWEPRVRVRSVTSKRTSVGGMVDNAVVVDVSFDVLDDARSRVLAQGESVQVQV